MKRLVRWISRLFESRGQKAAREHRAMDAYDYRRYCAALAASTPPEILVYSDAPTEPSVDCDGRDPFELWVDGKLTIDHEAKP